MPAPRKLEVRWRDGLLLNEENRLRELEDIADGANELLRKIAAERRRMEQVALFRARQRAK
jgi:hypothetical protein